VRALFFAALSAELSAPCPALPCPVPPSPRPARGDPGLPQVKFVVPGRNDGSRGGELRGSKIRRVGCRAAAEAVDDEDEGESGGGS